MLYRTGRGVHMRARHTRTLPKHSPHQHQYDLETLSAILLLQQYFAQAHQDVRLDTVTANPPVKPVWPSHTCICSLAIRLRCLCGTKHEGVEQQLGEQPASLQESLYYFEEFGCCCTDGSAQSMQNTLTLCYHCSTSIRVLEKCGVCQRACENARRKTSTAGRSGQGMFCLVKE